MFLLNNIKVSENAQRTIDDVQYPPFWFSNPLERAKVGMIEVPDPVCPDDNLFISVENPDGSYTATARTAKDIAARLEANRLASIPRSVTMRQARLALLSAGLLPAVEDAIAGAGPAAKIEWEYAQEVERAAGLVPTMGAALGMTEAQLDALFIKASEL
tara:strand:- start:454 stop:930 length:477 start_codon:yes stop_codon:yes gene_type:complete